MSDPGLQAPLLLKKEINPGSARQGLIDMECEHYKEKGLPFM